MKIFHYQDVEAKDAEEGALKLRVRWLITKEMGASNFAMRLFEMKPGGYSPFHSHPWEHEVFVLEGEGLVVRLRRLAARFSPNEDRLLRRAANNASLTLSDLLRRPALTMAKWKIDETTYACTLQEKHQGDDLKIDIRGTLMKSKSPRYLFPRIGKRIDRRFPRVGKLRNG